MVCWWIRRNFMVERPGETGTDGRHRPGRRKLFGSCPSGKETRQAFKPSSRSQPESIRAARGSLALLSASKVTLAGVVLTAQFQPFQFHAFRGDLGKVVLVCLFVSQDEQINFRETIDDSLRIATHQFVAL